MRVSNQMLHDTTVRNAQRHLTKMMETQNQLATGKALQRPSDNPTAAAQALLLRSSLSQQEQFQTNIDRVGNWLETTDVAIGEAGTVLARLRELVVQASTSSLSSLDRQIIASEVSQLKEQMVQVANTQLSGRYIFGGAQTEVAPYPAGPNDTTVMSADVGPQVQLEYNSTGVGLFGPTGGPSVFAEFDTILAALNADDTTALTASLATIDTRQNTFLVERAVIGGKLNRIELLQSRYASTELLYKDLLSKAEDVDMAKVLSEFSLQQNVYQASLQAGAKVIQPTLMDFLR